MLAYLDTIIGFSVLMLGISLLITILNQIVSSLFAHRGSNLRWGLEVLFKQAGPGPSAYPILAQNARLLSDIVLTHPLISDSTFSTNPKSVHLVRKNPHLFGFLKRWQLASGIRPVELALVLQHIVDNRPSDLPKNVHAALRHELDRLLKQPSPQTVRGVALAASAGLAVPTVTVQVPGAPSTPSGNLDVFHGQIMDRVRQRFTMWMRLWTVGFAFTIAGLLCVDSLDLIRTIYTNSTLRSQLVNAAPQTIASAVRLTPVLTDPFTTALNQALQSAKLPATASDINSESDGETWIRTHVDASSQDAVLKSFQANTQAELKTTSEAAGQVLSALSTGGLPKFGIEEWTNPAKKPWQLPGVLISCLLLSLGAPFWFNTLNSLTSLRPLLASPSPTQSPNKVE